MRIEKIIVKNFRALHNIAIENVPPMAVFIGENGSGKSTFFQIFRFLKNSLKDNVNIALQKMGGYDEVVTRENQNEPIEIEIKFRLEITNKKRLVTYSLSIAREGKRAFVRREVLRYKRGESGSPFHFLDFKNGKGYAINNEEDFAKEDKDLTKEKQNLEASDILAIKGLGQFKRFKAASAFRNLIENWHLSDFHIDAARQRAEAGVAEHLSEKGDNLPLVARHLYENHPDKFAAIVTAFKEKIPGMSDVSAETTPDGYILLRFKDGTYKNPFIARFVSDGTIKMFAYLILLHDPKPHPFLCIEEPENQLYPELLGVLTEELRDYAQRGGQVFVSSHSPDVLNMVKINEAFLLKKENGTTKITALAKNERLKKLIEGGDQLGYLWRQKLLEYT